MLHRIQKSSIARTKTPSYLTFNLLKKFKNTFILEYLEFSKFLYSIVFNPT